MSDDCGELLKVKAFEMARREIDKHPPSAHSPEVLMFDCGGFGAILSVWDQGRREYQNTWVHPAHVYRLEQGDE